MELLIYICRNREENLPNISSNIESRYSSKIYNYLTSQTISLDFVFGA